jgi:hypothetical protein
VSVGVAIQPTSVEKAAWQTGTNAVDGCANQPIPGPQPSSTLTQQNVTVEGPPVGSVHVEGIVEGACPSSHELGLSADDIRESTSDIQITSSESIDLSQLALGKAVDATVRIGTDGSYELTGISRDDGIAGASDSGSGQGDQASS